LFFYLKRVLDLVRKKNMENCSANLKHAIKWSELCFPEEISLEKIVRSGQCFRPREIFPSCFRFITKDSILYLKQVSAKELAFYINITEEGDGEARETTEKQWKKIWLPYFDGKRKYGKIERKSREDDYLQKCIAYGKGLRVLRQDPFETLLTFILSQRKSIPAIRSSVEKLCERFGEKQYSKVEEKEVYLFPRAEALQDADFSECSLGYRAPFVRDAVERVLEKRLDLCALDRVPTEELLSKLMEVHGVGIKVAACVALFAYSRMDIIPEDVWMKRIWDKAYCGENPYLNDPDGGIIQQYLFHYAIHHKEEW
jgi:8-oxoguanine-DNA-glycosylase